MEFFHINKDSDEEWVIGAKFTFGQQNNKLWETFENGNQLITSDGRTYPVDQIAYQALEVYRGGMTPPLKQYHYNPVQTLSETLDSLFCSIRNTRELMFEQVRLEKYASLPSRKTCIWLIPNDQESLDYWQENLPRGNNRKIFRVRTNGVFHRTSQQWVQGGTFSLSNWRERAHNYWKGTGAGNIDDEILFAGELEIIDEISI